MLLFVYGTLRRGERNHPQLGDARFVRTARSLPNYELVHVGGFPALLEQGRTAIIGELYDVDAAQLARLDAFEDVPNLYLRKPIWLEGARVDAYVMPRQRALAAPRIAHGDWCRAELSASS